MKKEYLLCLALLACCHFAFAENRVALLIANGAYKNFGALTGPTKEAESLSAALKGLGFDVRLIENATREQMLDELDGLKARVSGKGGIAFFHYGGHGVQVDGQNYLIPVDAEIPDERKVTTHAVNIEEVMTSLDSCGSETNIVILDACRNNPLPASSGRSASRGLSVVAAKPKNSVIVYSAEAGTVAQDGLFTPALTKYLQEDNLSFTDVLLKVRNDVNKKSNGAQTPGEYNQLFNNIYLKGTPAAATATTAQPPATSVTATSAAPVSAASSVAAVSVPPASYGGIIGQIAANPKINMRTFERDYLKGKEILYDSKEFSKVNSEWRIDSASPTYEKKKAIFHYNVGYQMASIAHTGISKGTTVYFKFKPLTNVNVNVNLEGPNAENHNSLLMLDTEGTYFTVKTCNSKDYSIVTNLTWADYSIRYIPEKEYIVVFDYDYQGFVNVAILGENGGYSFYRTDVPLADNAKTFVLKVRGGSVELIDYLEIMD